MSTKPIPRESEMPATELDAWLDTVKQAVPGQLPVCYHLLHPKGMEETLPDDRTRFIHAARYGNRSMIAIPCHKAISAVLTFRTHDQ